MELYFKNKYHLIMRLFKTWIGKLVSTTKTYYCLFFKESHLLRENQVLLKTNPQHILQS